MADKFRFTASVEESHLNKIQQVAKKLASKGFQVDGVLEIIGIITGTTDSLSKIDSFRMKGIKHIEPEGDFQLPDSPLQ